MLAGVAALALLTTACGDSEADCWAKREALIAEIAAVPQMKASAHKAAYGDRVATLSDWNIESNVRYIQAFLARDLPDC